MNDTTCPKCGPAAGGTVCPGCGHAVTNGSARPTSVKPPMPPAAADWVIHPVPPEVLKGLREAFDEAEFVAALREVERTGGVPIDTLTAEIERLAHGSE